MIVWLASYPRSGNTFTRIVLHHVYGMDTFSEVQAADDLSYDKGAGNLTGNRDLSELWPDGKKPEDWNAWMRSLEESDEVYFIKTHRFAFYLDDHRNYRTILLVRNGMDVFISLANYFIDVLYTWPRFFKKVARQRHYRFRLWVLRMLFWDVVSTLRCSLSKVFGFRNKMVRHFLKKEIHWKNWKTFYDSWRDRKEDNLAAVRFDDLVADPVEAMAQALKKIDVDIPFKGGEIPSFEELKRVHPKFFRKGRSGTWKSEFPEDLQPQFWEVFGPTMESLGFSKPS